MKKPKKKAMPPAKRPAWRPTAYRPEYCEEIIEFMKDGASIVEFAAHVGVDDKTIYNWAERYPEFLQAKSLAMAKCQAWWAKTGREYLINEPNGETLNNSNWIFNMKARFRWTDQEKVQQSETAQSTKAEDDEISRDLEEE